MSKQAAWDHSTLEEFYSYYARESESAEAFGRFRRVRDAVLRAVANSKPLTRRLEVADIGCGAGSQSAVWAELGHSIHAIDVNGPLVELGRTRAAKLRYDIDFRIGSATNLPWSNASMDVCIALELLEHVGDWESCLHEFTRILRPGGVLFLSTTNQLCPLQEEFNLPLYGWYPSPLKRRIERLAVTRRPDLANYCKYPAVNWFTFYGLESWLGRRGFRCFDRFDIMNVPGLSPSKRAVLTAVRSVPLLRVFGHICTPGTRLLAIRTADETTTL